MGKSALVTPLYISVAWVLLITYQLFTQTAVSTVVSYIEMFWPQVGGWLSYRMDVMVFVHSFAWIFLLSSVIPSVLLGKYRSVLVQFAVCLMLTFLAFIIQDVLKFYELEPLSRVFGLCVLFENLFFAVLYLSVPYISMLVLDLYLRRKRAEDEEFEKIKAIYRNQAATITKNSH